MSDCATGNCGSTVSCGTGGWKGPKPGDPVNDSVLRATGEFGGIQVSWTMPSLNAYAVSHTQVYRSATNDLNTAYLATTVNASGWFDVSAAQDIRMYYYWIRHVSINGTEMEFIGPASATARPSIDEVIALLSNRIEMSALAQSLRDRINVIQTLENGLTEVNDRIITDNSYFSDELVGIRNALTNALAYINEQREISVTEQQSLVTALNTQVAQFGENLYAAIQEESTVRAGQTGELFALKTIKTDLAGNVSGYGLSASVDPDGIATSDFRVSVDTFSIAPPSVHSSSPPSNPFDGKVWMDTRYTPPVPKWYNTTTNQWQESPVKGATPFIVKTTPEIINGITIPAGVYIDSAYVSMLSANKIDTRGLTIRDNLGNVIFGSGSNLSLDYIDGLGDLARLDSVEYNAIGGDKPPFDATRNNVYRQATAPFGATTNDLWFRTDNASVYYWNGSQWILAGDRTANNVAAGIAGQGALATQNNVFVGSTVRFSDGTVLGTGDFVNRLSKISAGNISTFISDLAIGNAYIGHAAIKAANIEDLAVNTLKIGNYAVSTILFAEGIYSASVGFTANFPCEIHVVGMFTQGTGKGNHIWDLFVNGDGIHQEKPAAGTTGSLAGSVVLGAGYHQASIQCATQSGDGRCRVLVFLRYK